MQLKFSHGIGAVSVDRLNTYIQQRRDFFVGISFGDELDDLALWLGLER